MKRSTRNVVLVACAGLAAIRAPARAQQQADPAATPVPRQVLLITSSKQEDRASDTTDSAHELLQMPLNYLGMVVHMHDLREGPPVDVDFSRLRAVLTYFDGSEPRSTWLWPWLEKEVAPRGLRVVHFGVFGPLAYPGPGETRPVRLTRWLRRFGLDYDDRVVHDPFRIRVEYPNPRLANFESSQSYRRLHLGPRNHDPTNRVWVATVDSENPADRRSPVVTGPWGGIALYPWAGSEGGGAADRRWYVDPFAFFRAALGLEAVPAPDPSVLDGRRMFFLHVDGDGFESLSTVRHGAMAARVFLDEVIDRYALPMTVSVIVASLTPDLEIEQETPAMELAREILNRPSVEPASHGVLHALDWRKDPRGARPGTVVAYPSVGGYRYDPVAEVRESIRFINERLLRDGRRCVLMLWTGAANPPQAAILEASRMGCGNLNGGIYRFDEWIDSVAFVQPWGKQLGSAFQVYCGAPNENVFDGYFTTMPSAYRHVDRTLENTGRERILKPADLYVHFYAAERPARLRALRERIERWGLREPTIPVFASVYARAVVSAQTACHISRTAGGWSFRGFGDCRTVRIDGERRFVDWSRSRGLIGARRMKGALYLHLARADADVVWAPAKQDWAHIEQANHVLRGVEIHERSVRLVSAATHARVIVFAGLPAGCRVDLVLDGERHDVEADARGCFRLALPAGTTRVEVRRR